MKKMDRKTPKKDDTALLKPLASADDGVCEECITPQTAETDPPPQGRVGLAEGRYLMTPAFDEPLSEFEEYK